MLECLNDELISFGRFLSENCGENQMKFLGFVPEFSGVVFTDWRSGHSHP